MYDSNSNLKPAQKNEIFKDIKRIVTMAKIKDIGSKDDMQIIKNKRREQKRILIVDDQIFNINALLIILEHSVKIDCQSICDKATNGKEALKIIENNVNVNKKNGIDRCDY
jgi:PleD family two-component response regulator